MDERGLEIASTACGVLCIVFFGVLVLFREYFLPQVDSATTYSGSTLIGLGGFVLVVVGALHRSLRDGF
ncbi:MAG: hypothetical protein R2762_09420 [Bryobacteraceae bacterium]